VNAEPPLLLKTAPRRRNSIFLPSEPSLTGKNRPAMNLDRDGAEKPRERSGGTAQRRSRTDFAR